MTAEQTTKEAYRLREQAVFHKRQARKHSRLAKTTMQELAQFCARNGIAFEVVSRGGMDDDTSAS